MPLITPKRRFLITAPLALLLPAGLLTYLGLETVRGVEMQYQEMARKKVSDISSSVRNSTRYRLIYTLQHPFRDSFNREGIQQIETFPIPEGFEIHLTSKLPTVGMMFVYGPDQNLYFFQRKTPQNEEEATEEEDSQEGDTWILSPYPHTDFINRIKGAIDYEVTRESIQQPPRTSSFSEFRPMHYPDELYPLDGRREVAFYTLISSVSPDGNEPWIQAIGFTINFEYFNRYFFQNLLNEISTDLEYPISIEDDMTRQWVAETNDPGNGVMKESTNYLPQTFHSDFPWYKIHFSALIGEDVMQIANYLRIFYYCLIAVANIVMVASVYGALRNISRELALSDMRSNFVARVSHELRTPLGLIRLYSETLELNRAKNEDKRKEYLHAITKESERLTHMINNILNFSRIEAHSQHYTFALDNIDSIVLETVETMRYHFERHGLEIHVTIAEDLPKVRVDAEALQQALYNLLNNAMKYSRDGKDVEVQAFRSNGEIVIGVTDHGIGIAQDQQEKIFEEFYRVDDPLVRETGGSGLGLAVVKHIVTAHKGRMSIQSKLRQGSTFFIYLPIPKE